NQGRRNNPYENYESARWRVATGERVTLYGDWDRSGPLSPGPSVSELIPAWARTPWFDPALVPQGDDDSPDPRWATIRTVDARGWPCLALSGGYREPHPGGEFAAGAHFALVWPARLTGLAWEQGGHVILPLAPIWPGFVSDIAFYAILC